MLTGITCSCAICRSSLGQEWSVAGAVTAQRSHLLLNRAGRAGKARKGSSR